MWRLHTYWSTCWDLYILYHRVLFIVQCLLHSVKPQKSFRNLCWQLVHLLYPIEIQQRTPSTTTWYNLLQMIKTGSYIRGPSPLECFDSNRQLHRPTLATSPQNPHLLTGVWQSNLHQAVERRPIETMETRIVSRCEAHVKPWLLNGSKFRDQVVENDKWKHIQS